MCYSFGRLNEIESSSGTRNVESGEMRLILQLSADAVQRVLVQDWMDYTAELQIMWSPRCPVTGVTPPQTWRAHGVQRYGVTVGDSSADLQIVFPEISGQVVEFSAQLEDFLKMQSNKLSCSDMKSFLVIV
ncbi:hypothetical protein CRUP_014178 [Coryphaenoides rupestris]|nr:hypothetical protein CRUP_014178 [Coryphaenoides rupestris]